MLMSPVGLRSEKGCAGDAWQKLKLQALLLVREGAPLQQTRNCLQIIKGRKGKIGLGTFPAPTQRELEGSSTYCEVLSHGLQDPG
jgi:hypothetical protein